MGLGDFFDAAISEARNKDDSNIIEKFRELTSNGNWDPQLLPASSKGPTPNAFMFGLIVNDWDKSLRSRNTKIKTEDLQIPFQNIESIPDWTKAAQYADMGTDIIGRYESYAVYTSSAAQEFNINLRYNAYAYDNTDTTSYWTLENIELLDKRIKSLVYPMYTKGFAPPPKLLLNIGNIFHDFPIVVKQVQIKNNPPYDYRTGLSMNREIELTVRSAYPAWQAMSGDKIYLAKSSRGAGNSMFAYKKLTVDFTKPQLRDNNMWGL